MDRRLRMRKPSSKINEMPEPSPENNSAPEQTPSVEKKPIPEFELRVAPDSLSVQWEGRLSAEEIEAVAPEIEDRLKALHIASVPDCSELAGRLRAGLQDGCVRRAIVVEGQTAVPPEKPAVEWMDDFFKTEFVIDEHSGAVDYRRRQDHRTVHQDQLLAWIPPPAPGTDGCDVYGKRIPAGKAAYRPLKAGKNVRQETEDGKLLYYATASGRIRLSSNTLSVDDVLVISGDVDLETGNIVHAGSLIVRGDVNAGLGLEVEGDIEIIGSLEAADVKAGGSLTVHMGITGEEDRVITTGGGVSAKFIRNAVIRAQGDVTVESEIVNSNVKTRGALLAPSARIVGSDVTALGGVQAGQAGSAGLLRTVLTAGEDYLLPEVIEPRKEQMAQSDKELKEKQRRSEILTSLGKTLTAAEREEFTLLFMEIDELTESIEGLKEEIHQAVAQSQEKARLEIRIQRTLHAETTLRIGHVVKKTEDARTGPLKAVLRKDEIVLRNE